MIRGLRALLVGTCVLGVVGSTFAQQLPEGKGKEETVKVCGTCHPPERGASVRLTRAGWQEVITKMVSLGAKGTDPELEAVLEYLATNFKGDAAKPINLNTAPAIDLEAVAGLLRKEAATWIALRSKTPCKTLDDLRKAKGIDFKKIDARRDRLVCF
jgi:competence protein ComEA